MDQLELNSMKHSQLITVEDRTSKDTLTAAELFNAVWAVNYQAMFQYGRSTWVTQSLAPAGHLMLLPHDSDGVAKPPQGAWNIILLDDADQAGALGWHDDGTNDIPYAEVFVKTAREAGVPWSEVLSHETIEMLVDPFVDPANPRSVAHNGYLWIVEACDAVQGNGYDVGDPENRHVGVTVADWCEPSWWNLGMRTGSEYSFRNSVASPFELAQQGYISRKNLQDHGAEWESVFGEMIETKPSWASRLPRVHNA